jgi:hypothetical protein
MSANDFSNSSSQSRATYHLDRNHKLAGVDSLLDLLDHPEDDSRLVLERSSEFVGSLVDSAGKELGQKVPVGGVYMSCG